MNKKQFVIDTLKNYAKENGLKTIRPEEDISKLEKWLIDQLYKKTRKIDINREYFIEILMKLYSIFSLPGKENAMRKFINEFIISLNRDNISIIEINKNISIKRSNELTKVVLLNAHMDAWMDNPEDFLSKITITDKITAEGFCIGNDDKVGIAMILYLLKYTEIEFKAILTHSEEIGSIGIKTINKEYYNDCFFGISLDRRRGNDLITTYGGRKMVNDNLIEYIESISHLKETPGIFADTYYISYFVQAFNMSVGYYGEHKKNDYVIIDEALESLNFIKEFLEEVNKANKIEMEKKNVI